MQDSADPSDTLLLSPLFLGCLLWGAAMISFGHREIIGTWPAELGGVGAVLFAGVGVAFLGYGVAARTRGAH